MPEPKFRRGAQPDPTPIPTPARVVFTAKYDGYCPLCDDDIVSGVDEIVWSEDEQAYVHADEVEEDPHGL